MLHLTLKMFFQAMKFFKQKIKEEVAKEKLPRVLVI